MMAIGEENPPLKLSVVLVPPPLKMADVARAAAAAGVPHLLLPLPHGAPDPWVPPGPDLWKLYRTTMYPAISAGMRSGRVIITDRPVPYMSGPVMTLHLLSKPLDFSHQMWYDDLRRLSHLLTSTILIADATVEAIMARTQAVFTRLKELRDAQAQEG